MVWPWKCKILCDRFYNGKDFFLLSDDLNANIVTGSKEADALMIALFICFMAHYSNIFVCLSKHRNVGVLSVLPVQSHLLHYITSNEQHDVFLLVTHSSISTELTAKFQLNSPQKNDVATLMLLGGRSFTVTILKDCAYHCSNFYFILPPTWTETRQLCIKRRAGKCCIYSLFAMHPSD